MNRSFRNLSSSNHSTNHNDRRMNYSADPFDNGDIEFFDGFDESLWEQRRVPPAALLHDIRVHETAKSKASKSRKQSGGTTYTPRTSKQVLLSPRNTTRIVEPAFASPLPAERRSNHSTHDTPTFFHDGTSDLHQTNTRTAHPLVNRGSRRSSFCDDSDYTPTTQSSTTVSTAQVSSRKSRTSSPRGRRRNSIVARTPLNADEQKQLFNCEQVPDRQPSDHLEYSLRDLFQEELPTDSRKKAPARSSGKTRTKKRTSSRLGSGPAAAPEPSASNAFVREFQVWLDEPSKANSKTESNDSPSSFPELFQCQTGIDTPKTPANIKRVLLSKQTHIKAMQEIDRKKRRAPQRSSSGKSRNGSQPRLARKSSSSSSGTKMRRSSSSRQEARPGLSVRRKSSSKSTGRKKMFISVNHHQPSVEDTPKARRVRRASAIQNGIPIDSFFDRQELQRNVPSSGMNDDQTYKFDAFKGSCDESISDLVRARRPGLVADQHHRHNEDTTVVEESYSLDMVTTWRRCP